LESLCDSKAKELAVNRITVPISVELESQKAIMLVLVTLAQLISREGSFWMPPI
jgi:hypothetical protein